MTGSSRRVLGPPADHLLTTELDGNISLYDPKRDEVHVLNVSATEIWRMLDGSLTLEEVVAEVASAHSVDPEDIRGHVAGVVSTFIDRGLLCGAVDRWRASLRKPPSRNRLYQVLGLTITVGCDDPRANRDIDRLLAPFLVPGDNEAAVGRRYTLVAEGGGKPTLRGDGLVIARRASWEPVISALFTDINRSAIEDFPGFAVHAGAVATKSGVVTFPAASGAGKSVLTAACGLAGFGYVSDEALCIADKGHWVVPYPKPIALSPDGWSMVGHALQQGDGSADMDKVLIGSKQLGIAVAPAGLRLAHVVGLTRRDGPARLVAVPRSEALAAILRMSFNHFKRPGLTFALVSDLAAESQAWRLEYSEPTAAARLLLSELGT